MTSTLPHMRLWVAIVRIIVSNKRSPRVSNHRARALSRDIGKVQTYLTLCCIFFKQLQAAATRPNVRYQIEVVARQYA